MNHCTFRQRPALYNRLRSDQTSPPVRYSTYLKILGEYPRYLQSNSSLTSFWNRHDRANRGQSPDNFPIKLARLLTNTQNFHKIHAEEQSVSLPPYLCMKRSNFLTPSFSFPSN